MIAKQEFTRIVHCSVEIQNSTLSSYENHSKTEVWKHWADFEIILKQEFTLPTDELVHRKPRHSWRTHWALCCSLPVPGEESKSTIVTDRIWLIWGFGEIFSQEKLFTNAHISREHTMIIYFQAILLQQWHLPPFLCRFCPTITVLSVNVSVLTLVCPIQQSFRCDIHLILTFSLLSGADKPWSTQSSPQPTEPQLWQVHHKVIMTVKLPGNDDTRWGSDYNEAFTKDRNTKRSFNL